MIYLVGFCILRSFGVNGAEHHYLARAQQFHTLLFCHNVSLVKKLMSIVESN